MTSFERCSQHLCALSSHNFKDKWRYIRPTNVQASPCRSFKYDSLCINEYIDLTFQPKANPVLNDNESVSVNFPRSAVIWPFDEGVCIVCLHRRCGGAMDATSPVYTRSVLQENGPTGR